ncbi:amidohydrolase [Legionella israelensis]|uniref:N-substituted formamide deformylase n=1 Tax=Legionella israelensis TaxID=454 RepID=A0A0W0V4H7_9GAMM|nr:amidohydrolase family protein [Legionella israelensis]KTD14997.1 N-substituted formamide deformylase precursor [Legionella israelensis]QBS10009.1 hypothetical protein E4T55_09165 [Legionella israelensis]SCX78093.1 hypothetical protein SAMN02746069_00146 [Legionella israelensis DSM 19235]STX59587.1 N-substituted formamide deformylase precursor [Legionella israelensis]
MQYVVAVVFVVLIDCLFLSPVSAKSTETPPFHLCQDAHQIYHNATFITLDPQKPRAEAVAVIHHRLAAVGDEKTIMEKCRGSHTEIIDLKKAYVTPGFIDSGSLLVLYGWLANHSIDLSTTNTFHQKNWKPIKTTDMFLSTLADKISASNEQQIIVYGYDSTRLKGEPLTQNKLNKISKDKAIVVFYSSEQSALLNDKAAREIKELDPTIAIDEEGKINSKDFQSFLVSILGKNELEKAIMTAIDFFSSQGYTTISENQFHPAWLDTYARIINNDSPVDVIFNASNLWHIKLLNLVQKDFKRFYSGYYILKIDGSLGDYAAYLSAPYSFPPIGYDRSWRGSLAISPRKMEEQVITAAKEKISLAFEAHGDAAIDVALNMTQKTQQKHPHFKPKLLNAQVIRKDQFQRMNYLSMSASWFAPHLYYWGEAMCHEIVGPERAHFNNPLRQAKKSFNTISMYANAPVTPLQPLKMMQRMQTRKVQSWQYPLNRNCPQYYAPHQRISAEDTLRAITIDNALFYGLEKEKGTLEVGKLADMTLLSADPLTPSGNSSIKVLGTISRGQLHMNL